MDVRTARTLATVLMVAGLGLVGVSAHERPIKMKFSGSMIPTSIEVQPDSITDEELLEGTGTLGGFTLRKLRTDLETPVPSPTCSGINISVSAGGGVFRFKDGSLLTFQISEGGLCIDPVAAVGYLTETYQITGGTGRFEGASGTLTSTATLHPVLFSQTGVAMLTSTGRLEGSLDIPDPD